MVLCTIKYFNYLTNLNGCFGKIYRIYSGTTLGPVIVLAEPKTCFYNSGYQVSKLEMEFHMKDIIYAAMPMCAQTKRKEVLIECKPE